MDEELKRLSVRELIMRLADTEATIRRVATPTEHSASEGPPSVGGQLIDLARAEQRIIGELRRRDDLTPTRWPLEQPLAG